jgi:hypothetical protein
MRDPWGAPYAPEIRVRSQHSDMTGVIWLEQIERDMQ